MPEIFVSPASPQTPKANGKVNSPNPLSAFMFMPQGVSFENQEQDETIVLLLRKHFITNLPWLFISVVLLLIPVTFFPFVVINNLIPQLPIAFFRLVAPVWYLFTGSYILVNFLMWYFTISIVTTERILDIDFINLLNKKVAETRLSKVEDVTQRSGGFFEAFFDYGNVIVQTAGTEPVFLFQSVPKPQQIVRIIHQLLERQEET
ncbi:hypothetical protein A3D78_03720 [Candidatus Gottesmanbacteria bacterium RIFCSPHIGHO2_02_FULL_39_14]|uniref:DUF304 domain-containing protein n=1 Tax=Candidatus Gottesmanbacteria bacterium RIFCSPHIGHO2_02_FULL_39_14 TaxID=1798383 RepID=A0A1F5ZXG2_9BACT|nr:MAG: hypothetical protein A3D78_03720 [Candidatus Gottesmanbacteria bacterium RIFCSPHIGHO2_02_FULL_39_14]